MMKDEADFSKLSSEIKELKKEMKDMKEIIRNLLHMVISDDDEDFFDNN